MSTLELRNVKKSYDKKQVVHGVNANIEAGQFVVIVGPSGCGKSTLLRMIAGLETISDGEICINGKVVNNIEPADRDIAMVFQNYALYPHMSVYKNMAYGLKIRGYRKDEIDKRIIAVAEKLHLENELDKKPKQLSGGQRQRVAMGRVMVREPAVFLFDEPLSNLDAKLRTHMRLEIKKLHQSLKTTSVYVTHDQIEAMTLADKIIVMNQGRVEQIGTPSQVYQQPATQFVADFIGNPSMNFIETTVKGHQLKINHHYSIALPASLTTDENENLIFGVRPEHFSLADKEAGAIRVKIDVIEDLGNEVLIHGLLNNDQKLTARFHKIHSKALVKEYIYLVPTHYYLFTQKTKQLIYHSDQS